MPWLADANQPATTGAGATSQRMLRELAQALEAMSAVRPIVLWVEDLHWSDLSTRDALSFLARRSDPARLLIIGSWRPAEAHARGHPVQAVKEAIALCSQCRELALGFLGLGDVSVYLQRRFALEPAELGELSQFLHARTSGNPLFVVALADDLVRSGALRHQRYQLAADPACLRDQHHHSRHRPDPDRPADRKPRRRRAARAADRGGERRGILRRGDRRDTGARHPGGRGDLRPPGAAPAVHHAPRQPRLARRHRRQPLCLRARHVPGGAGQPRLRGTARRMARQDRRARGTGLWRRCPRHRRSARRPLRGGAPLRPQREVPRAGGAQCAGRQRLHRGGPAVRQGDRRCCRWPSSTIPPRPSCACCCRAASPSS